MTFIRGSLELLKETTIRKGFWKRKGAMSLSGAGQGQEGQKTPKGKVKSQVTCWRSCAWLMVMARPSQRRLPISGQERVVRMFYIFSSVDSFRSHRLLLPIGMKTTGFVHIQPFPKISRGGEAREVMKVDLWRGHSWALRSYECKHFMPPMSRVPSPHGSLVLRGCVPGR